MRVEKKKADVDLITARIFTFSMAFIMMFVIPFVPFGCQSQRVAAIVFPSDSLVVWRDPASTVMTALDNAAIGGPAGATIARQMDELAARLKGDTRNAAVARIGEGVVATFDSRSFFNDDCYTLSAAAKRGLRGIARLIRSRESVDVLIECHTDDTAEEAYNYFLSDNRADAVRTFLLHQGIGESRIKARGYGEKQPLRRGDARIDRSLNRRIEVVFFASDDMRYQAKQGKLDGLIASKRAK